jgi:hypothetical protein
MPARVSSPERTRAICAIQRELTNVANGDVVNAEYLFDTIVAGVHSEIKRLALEEQEERARQGGRANMHPQD